MKINNFEDLVVWQQSRLLVSEMYSLTNANSFRQDYEMKSQIRRATLSSMLNIAEGFERKSPKEFIQFLFIAKASIGEVRSALYACVDLNYIDKESFEIMKGKCAKIGFNFKLCNIFKELS